MGGRAPARLPEPRRPLAARAGPTPVVMDFVVWSCYDRPMKGVSPIAAILHAKPWSSGFLQLLLP